MNLTVKRCLLGLVAWATMFGIARAQFQEPAGTVQLGPPSMNSGQGLPPSPTQVSDFGSQPVPNGTGALYGMTQVDRLFAPRVNIDSRGGGLYGYQAGYSNIGVFAPYKLEENAILFVHGMGLITYDGRGGATVGTGWRYWMEGLDRIVGLSAWFDFDNGHAQPYQQVGLSFESLGRYVDYRANGYIPISNADHVLYSQLTPNAVLYGSGIGLIRNNTIEQSYTGFDVEMGGPTPILGRYGLNAYLGGYYFTGNGQRGGDFTGVSGRILAQINEDVSFGVQVTDDHVFGLNTQFQVFVNLPDGKPSRWFRNPRVHDRLVQNVFRQNRVIAKTDSFRSIDVAIDPTTHRPYFVANIDPNLGTGGNGMVNSQFNSVAQYESVPLSQRQQYDIILVRPRTDSTSTNLDTASTLQLFDGQRLLSTSINHTFFTANLPGQELTLPGFTGGSAPMLVNSSGGDVITLTGGNSRPMEVSGFDITGSATGNGIRGNNNLAVSINNNNIHGSLNGVRLTNLSGTIASGKEFLLYNNNIHDNLANGVEVTNAGSPPFANPLEVIVQNNIFNSNANDGLKFVAQSGGSIGGVIGGENTASTPTSPAINRSNTFSSNLANGLELNANGGTLNFLTLASDTTSPTFGIVNNIFTGNGVDGLHIATTNNSLGSFDIISNTFGNSSDNTLGNQRYGISLASDSGTNLINIGGATAALGNSFFGDLAGAVTYNLTGTNITTTNIQNNTILINNTIGGAVLRAGFTQNSLAANDDGSTALVPIGFTADFFGVNFNQLFVNNNGNVTLNQALATFTPFPIVTNGIPMLAPFFADVDTRSGNIVTYGTGTVNGHLAFGVNWADVRHFSALGGGSNGLPTNNFQLVLIDRSDIAPGDFDFEFNYKQIQWEAGQASGSNSQGLGGDSARVGYTNGVSNSYEFAGSGVNGALLDTGPVSTSLIQNSLNSNVLGRYDFFVRDGLVTNGTPGNVNGFQLNVSDNAHLQNSTVSNNTAHGVNGYALQVNVQGNGIVDNFTVNNNDFSRNDGGIQFNQFDNGTIQALVSNNLLTQNRFNGLEINANGSNDNVNITLTGNTLDQNVGSGLVISSSGSQVLTVNSTGNSFNRNGGDNILLTSNDTSVLNVNLANVVSTNSFQSGLNATSRGNSTLNLLVTSPLTGAQSSFSNNTVNGIVLNSKDTSFMHASIYDTLMTGNGVNGILFNREAASLVRANIVNSSMSTNGVNGFNFHGLGSDPQDPTQQFSGTPNRINLIQDSLNNNGTNGVGQGARLDLFGDSQLVLNANATTFDSNAQNGIRIKLTPGAQFGYLLGNERSVLDNVDISNNGANGVFITSDITVSQPGNGFLPFDADSLTYMQISSNTGNTSINNNVLNGILLQYTGGIHDILVAGDLAHATPQFGTSIQSNKQDGIHSESGIEADVVLTVDGVLIGGPNAINGNLGDGIDFEAQSTMRVVDGATHFDWLFNAAGVGTLNVNNSTIQNNQGHGINLIGNDLAFNGLDANGNFATRTTNNIGDGSGQLSANITNSRIVQNNLDGINIDLQGRMGFRGVGNTNSFVLSNNIISNNGQFGVFMQQNAALDTRGVGSVNDLFRVVNFFDPQPTTPPGPFDPDNLTGPPALSGWNEGNQTDLAYGFLQSNWMNLRTANNSSLVMTDNFIQYNGRQTNLQTSDGVFIRVSTNSYLSADIQRNTMSGNVANDLHIESFVAYNPATGVAPQPTGSVARAAPAFDTVVLDDTAQLDLRLIGNVGNTINIVSPLVNYSANGTLPGNTTPNGAVYQPDPLKDNFSFTNPSPRVVQLFQVDNGPALDSTNLFKQNGITQNLQNIFFNSDWHLRAGADPLFPNLLFPQNYTQNPGDPFLP